MISDFIYIFVLALEKQSHEKSLIPSLTLLFWACLFLEKFSWLLLFVIILTIPTVACIVSIFRRALLKSCEKSFLLSACGILFIMWW